MTFKKNILHTILPAFVIVATQSGCVGHRNSYKVTGHEMGIRLLSEADLNSYAATTWTNANDTRASKFEERLTEVYGGPNAKIEPVTTAAIASFIAGVIVDYTKARLEAEAKKYEAQFTAWDTKSSFWSIVEGTDKNGNKKPTVQPNWTGIEVVRWTKSSPKLGNDPAFRLVAAFVINPNDNRWFDIRPLFLQTRESKAKVAWRASKLTSNIKLSVSANWVTKELNTTLDKEVGRAEWEVTGYDLDKSKPMFFSDKDFPGGNPFIAGTFAAPPLSYLDEDIDGKPDGLKLGDKRATPFKVTVQVTEKDETKAKQYIERIAKFVGEKKEDIQAAAGKLGN